MVKCELLRLLALTPMSTPSSSSVAAMRMRVSLPSWVRESWSKVRSAPSAIASRLPPVAVKS